MDDGVVYSAASSSSSPALCVAHVDKRRGRGVVAGRAFAAQTPLLAVRPDIAVLYSAFAGTHCAFCFADVRHGNGRGVACGQCDQFVLCHRCDQRRRCDGDDGAVSRLHAAHARACAWYGELPACVRAPGQDTDFVRFCLLYGARVQLGDAALVRAVASLDANADAQSPESRRFCEVFARDRVVATFGATAATATNAASATTPRYPVDADALREVLLRTRCNSLGFPFDARETLGWSLHATLCMLNHSCCPNAALVAAAHDADFARVTADGAAALAGCVGLKALRDIAAGDEVTISYVDLDEYGGDVARRQRHLLERYRFLCTCARCQAQRAQQRR